MGLPLLLLLLPLLLMLLPSDDGTVFGVLTIDESAIEGDGRESIA